MTVDRKLFAPSIACQSAIRRLYDLNLPIDDFMDYINAIIETERAIAVSLYVSENENKGGYENG